METTLNSASSVSTKNSPVQNVPVHALRAERKAKQAAEALLRLAREDLKSKNDETLALKARIAELEMPKRSDFLASIKAGMLAEEFLSNSKKSMASTSHP
jgi:hypothetical protein